MKLLDTDIETKEVLAWKGVHLLHNALSSCSQKTRIFLNLKGIDWISHPIDIANQKNFSPWFLGINPRGLVPVLVHDGDVHIESNDILVYLDKIFPSPSLIPAEYRENMLAALQEEDNLHLDLRSITMRFVLPKFLVKKKPASIEAYKQSKGIIGGEIDSHKEIELSFWNDYEKQGISDDRIKSAVTNFRLCFDKMEESLKANQYLQGSSITLIDIAWFIYSYRLITAGYPLSRLHPAVFSWYEKLLANKNFNNELATPLPLKIITKTLHFFQAIRGRSLEAVAGL